MTPVPVLLRRKRVWIPLGLFLIYTLAGFFVVPGILRQQIVSGIRQSFKREARLDRVRLNPLVWSLTLQGFELRDPDGTIFVAFDRLYLGLQASSLVRWAITLRDFRLDGPRVHVRVMPDGKPNFDDMIPKQSGKPPRLVLGRFEIHHGSVRVTSLQSPKPLDATVVPIELDLRNFTTIPQKSGNFEITAVDPGHGTWHWVGKFEFEPMLSSGVLEITDSHLAALAKLVEDQIPVDVAVGRFGCRVPYRVEVRGDSLIARIANSTLSIRDLALREKQNGAELMTMDSLQVSGVSLRYPEQSVGVARVLVAGTRIQVRMNADSTINWMTALGISPPGKSRAHAAARPAAASGAAAHATAAAHASATAPATAAKPAGGPGAAQPSAAAQPPAAAWNATLAELAVQRLGIQFEDHTVNPPFAVSVAPIDVSVRHLDTHPGATFDLDARLTIAERGILSAKGTVSAQPQAADLDIKLTDLPLPIFQPYLDSRAKLRLVSGTLGVAGAAQVRPGAKGQPEVSFKGQVTSRKFLTRDRIGDQPFLSWDEVDVNAIDFTTKRLGIGSVKINRPYGKLLIHKDRTTNFQDVLGIATVDSAAAAHEAEHPGPSASAQKGPAAQPKASEAIAEMKKSAAAAPFPVHVGAITIREGSADFADLSLILPFAARIEHLTGSVSSVSSDSASRATVEMNGKLQPSGTAEVKGTINPLAQETFLDLGVVFRDFNMPTLTPYSGEFLGRTIDKGSMSLDLGYRLQGRHLVGKNKITLDQLELGNKVESPEATHLPVGLAIAILKDKDGKIDLDVPVEGDVDDPQFRIGKVIWNFIMSLLKKVATAPFALLGSLFGGKGDEMSHVDFDAGSAAVATDQSESLNHLAQALAKRPQLRLEVRGRSDRDADATVLKKAHFAALTGERMAADPKKYGSALGVPTRLLQDLAVEKLGKDGAATFEQRYMKPAGELAPDQPGYKSGSKKLVLDEAAYRQAAQDTLTALQKVDDSDLLALASARGTAIKQQLVTQGVEEARVFLLDPESAPAQGGKIRIDLALRE